MPTQRLKEQSQRGTEFQGSLEGLLSIASEEVQAEGFALYEHDRSNGEFIYRCGHGVPAREPGSLPASILDRPTGLASPVSSPGLAIITFPLHGRHGLAGVIDFGFRDPGDLAPAQREMLERTAEAIEEILRFSHNTTLLQHLASRIKELEAHLADLKISERARGLLNQGEREDRVHMLLAHVTAVLSAFQLEESLAAQVKELEDRLAERHIVANAKALLQRKEGLTEEQAYLSLRATSRRTRRRLGQVAEEVLEG